MTTMHTHRNRAALPQDDCPHEHSLDGRCIACGLSTWEQLPPLETQEERLDRIRAAFAALPPATPAPAGAVDRARRVMDTPGWQDRFNTEGLPRGLHDTL